MDVRTRTLMERVWDALRLATGIAVEAEAPREVVALGDTVPVRVTVAGSAGVSTFARVGPLGTTVIDPDAGPTSGGR